MTKLLQLLMRLGGLFLPKKERQFVVCERYIDDSGHICIDAVEFEQGMKAAIVTKNIYANKNKKGVSYFIASDEVWRKVEQVNKTASELRQKQHKPPLSIKGGFLYNFLFESN